MPTLPPAVAKDFANLVSVVEQFVEGGVAVLPRWNEREGEIVTRITTTHMVRSYLRVVARDLKRPFVCALSYRPWSRITVAGAYERTPVHEWLVHIPHRVSLAPIVAPLIMLTEANSNHEGRYGHAIDPAKSSWWKRKTIDTFTIRGEMDIRFFEAWLEKCRTDPVYRKALKLDLPER